MLCECRYQGGRKQAPDLLELQFWCFFSGQMWVLGADSGCSVRVVKAHNHQAVSPALAASNVYILVLLCLCVCVHTRARVMCPCELRCTHIKLSYVWKSEDSSVHCSLPMLEAQPGSTALPSMREAPQTLPPQTPHRLSFLLYDNKSVILI